MGSIYINKGEYNKAFELLKKSGELYESSTHWRNLYPAYGYFYTQNYEKAVVECKSSINKVKDYVSTHTLLGEVYLKIAEIFKRKGKNELSESYIKQAESEAKIIKKIRPNYTEDEYLLGKINIARSEYDNAIEILNNAVKNKFSIDHARDIYTLATAYFEKEEMNEAIKKLKEIFGYNPNHARSHLMLAKAYEKKGDTKNAISWYKSFLDIWKNADKELEEIKEAIYKLKLMKEEIRK